MPASARDWEEPFLVQAREDLAAAWNVNAVGSASTLCMLLQMVFEKIAKSAFARTGNTIPLKHQVVRRLFLILESNRRGRTFLQKYPNERAFIVLLEDAQPSIVNQTDKFGPRLEYPWEDQAGIVYSPARDLALAKRVRDPKGRVAQDCLKFADAFAKELQTLFPDN